MSKGNKFSEQDLLNKGFVFDQESGQYVPRSITSPFIESIKGNVPKQENEPLAADIKLDIKTEWKISYNVPSKKNSKKIIPRKLKPGDKGRPFLLLPSDAHEEYKKMTEMQYKVFGIEFRRAVNFYGLEYPLRIELTYFRGSKHRFDYTNATDTVNDLLVLHKWIEDDSADHIIPVFLPYQYDKENPGVKIKLLLK